MIFIISHNQRTIIMTQITTVDQYKAAAVLAQIVNDLDRWTAASTIIMDLFQLQCVAEENADKLDFIIPTSMLDYLSRSADMLEFDATADIIEELIDGTEYMIFTFNSVEDQDKLIGQFQEASWSGLRAFPTPDVYQGADKPDWYFIRDIMRAMPGLVEMCKDSATPR